MINPAPTPPPSSTVDDAIRSQKSRCRHAALAARRELRHRLVADRAITSTVVGLGDYQQAQTVLCYVSLPEEVATDEIIAISRQSGKQIAVPYCHEGVDLKLFRLDDPSELVPGTFNVREPLSELRLDPSRQIEPFQLDLVIAPGVAFDAHGGRIGFGKGYFDRLLLKATRATFVGLAYEAQLMPAVPVLDHDVRMHCVVTERAVYRQGRRHPTHWLRADHHPAPQGDTA